jgi:hypothetical protein
MTHNHRIIKHLLFLTIVVLLTGCHVVAPIRTDTSTLPVQPTQNPGGLSPDAVSTLGSLEMINDYPFYVMHYVGDYPYSQTGSILPVNADFACSLFTALGKAGDKFYGRNFDWDFSPSLLLFTDPSDGYASVSMVNLSFLEISSADATNLTDLPLTGRVGLLGSPSLPFDGMNEYGLTIAMAAVPDEYADDASYNRTKPNIGSVGIIREILDHARNVDEAFAIFDQYNIIFRGGPPIHYLLADPSGKAALIEFYQGKMVRIPNPNPWHLATNHLRCIAKGDGGCWRYRTISERLTSMNGQLDPLSAMQLLADVKQTSTQWSMVYDMTSGDINVVIANHYDKFYSFHLDLLRP